MPALCFYVFFEIVSSMLALLCLAPLSVGSSSSAASCVSFMLHFIRIRSCRCCLSLRICLSHVCFLFLFFFHFFSLRWKLEIPFTMVSPLHLISPFFSCFIFCFFVSSFVFRTGVEDFQWLISFEFHWVIIYCPHCEHKLRMVKGSLNFKILPSIFIGNIIIKRCDFFGFFVSLSSCKLLWKWLFFDPSRPLPHCMSLLFFNLDALLKKILYFPHSSKPYSYGLGNRIPIFKIR